METIPVICDRCRAVGVAGEGAFADLGDLLDFEPVPRRPRADGWTPELQRAYIAALAVTGSPRRAARAVGKAQYGAEQLRKARGAEGFNVAWDKAMALFREKGDHRLAAGFAAVVREDARTLPGAGRANGHGQGRRLVQGAGPRAGGADDGEDPTPAQQAERALLATLVSKYMIKLTQEREARLEGRIVEADLYLRQLTWLEVALDMMSGDGLKLLRDYRCGELGLIDIAETPMARLLDAARRDHWVAAGDPPRPEHPIRRMLIDHVRFSTEPGEYTRGGIELSHEEQRARFEAQHALDAKAQVEWEAEARRDFERRREAPPCMDEEPGSAGQPAPQGRQD